MAGPTLKRRRLGRMLRALREDRGLTAAQAARMAGVGDQTTLSKLETSRTVAVNLGNVLDLCDTYDVDPGTRDYLLTLAREAARPGWWEPREDVKAHQSAYLELWSDARAVSMWTGDLVPAVFQTEGYYRSLMLARQPDVEPAELDRWWELRQEHQAYALTEVTIHAVISEGALTCPPDQYNRLVELAQHDKVTIHVIRQHFHPAQGNGPFTLFFLRDSSWPTAVLAEYPTGNVVLEKEVEVDEYRDTLERLAEIAKQGAAL